MDNRKPWYIWLSILAFVVLWSDTARKILLARKNPLTIVSDTKGFNLWIGALGQMFISIIVFIIIPVVTLGLIGGFVAQQFPNIEVVLEIGQHILLYLLGVYIAYKHVLWRKKNMI